MELEFRKDIEGLRALAVLPILLFHLDSGFCPGGFVGVDVFFVISGYLITRLVLKDGANFSFRQFYVRQFFRIFPALLATCVLSLVASWFILAPTDYASFARSAIAATFAVSNFYFYAAVDYFNVSTLLHPLLHTWSLGVEEQFYLVWPALIVLAASRGFTLWSLVAIVGVASFAAASLFRNSDPQLIFYMMPFRMFEFAAGAGVLAVEERWARAPKLANAALGAVGMGLLACACFRLDGNTPWPSVWTLAPALGTSTLILAGARGGWRALLANGAFRFIGRISYSLYLVHWPLIALYRYYAVAEPSALEIVGLGIGSIAMAWAMYAFVETPFRIRSAADEGSSFGWYGYVLRIVSWPKVRTSAIGAMSLVFLLGAVAVVVGDGLPSRLERGRVQYVDKGLTFAGDLCDHNRSRCMFGDITSDNVVYVMGDSHALNLIYGLDVLFKAQRIKGVAFYDHGCLFASGTKRFLSGVPDDRCAKHVEQAYAYISQDRRPVIFADDYEMYRNKIGPADAGTPMKQSEAEYFAWLRERFRASLARIGAAERPVVVFKQAYNTGVDLASCLSRPGAANTVPDPCAPTPFAKVKKMSANSDALIDALRTDFPSLIVFDPKEIFCRTEPCQVRDGATLYFRDASHLTNGGSDWLIRAVQHSLVRALASR